MFPRSMNIIQILIIYMIAAITADEPSYQLKRVLLVFRHGMRAPIRPFKIIPYCDEDYFPAGMGQLTNKGKRQVFGLGENLRKRYKTFIEPHNRVISKDVKVVSTNYERCLETAQVVLAGFYPPDKNQTWSSTLEWQPVPILSNSPDKTTAIANPKFCPYLQRIRMEAVKKIPELEEFQKIKNEAVKHDKYKEINQTLDVILLVDAVISVANADYELPKWMAEFYPKRIETLEKKQYELIITKNEKSLRIIAGTILSDIVKKIDEVAESNEFSKFYFYAGHDTTIFTILTALGIPQTSKPDFAASLIFEIYSTPSDNFAIKVIYSQDSSFAQKEVKVPNCDYLCPVEQFKEYVSNLMTTPDQWEKECNEDVNEFHQEL